MSYYNRRDLLKGVMLAGAGTTLGITNQAYTQETTSNDKPNILMLIADDVDQLTFGCYGHPTIKTPNLDKIAKNGVQFANAFVTTSSCSPSRSSVFTGRYPHATGAEDLHMPLPENQKIIPEYLKEAGYYTGNYQKLHLGKAKEAVFDQISGNLNQWTQFFDQRPKDQPFFLTIGFTDPHRPYQENTIPEPHQPQDVIVPPYLADEPEVRQDLAMYYDEISRLDSVVGDIIQRLKDDGLYYNTLILFWGDNGMPFPRAKTTLYDSGIATPMIAQWPGKIPAGAVDYGLASTVDLAPTFLEAAGLPMPEAFQGESMLDRLLSPNSTKREAIYADRNWHDIDDHARAVRTERFKYIRNYYPDEPLNDAADVLRSPTAVKMRELRDAGKLNREQLLAYRKHRAAEELYDLARDPYEFHNVAADPAYLGVLTELRTKLDQWIVSTNDVSPDRRRIDLFDRNTGERINQEWSGTGPYLDEIEG